MTLACTRVHCSRAAKSIIHGKIRFSVLPLCTHGSWGVVVGCGGRTDKHSIARGYYCTSTTVVSIAVVQVGKFVNPRIWQDDVLRIRFFVYQLLNLLGEFSRCSGTHKLQATYFSHASTRWVPVLFNSVFLIARSVYPGTSCTKLSIDFFGTDT